jgi:hypothetical protein
MDVKDLLADDGRLEENLRASESLVADDNDVAIGKLVGLLEGRGLSSSPGLLVEVKSDVGELLLDTSDVITLGISGERVASLSADIYQVVSQVPSIASAGNIHCIYIH